MGMRDVILEDLDREIVDYILDHVDARFLFDEYVRTNASVSQFYRVLAVRMAKELASR